MYTYRQTSQHSDTDSHLHTILSQPHLTHTDTDTTHSGTHTHTLTLTLTPRHTHTQTQHTLTPTDRQTDKVQALIQNVQIVQIIPILPMNNYSTLSTNVHQQQTSPIGQYHHNTAT